MVVRWLPVGCDEGDTSSPLYERLPEELVGKIVSVLSGSSGIQKGSTRLLNWTA
jgi:hypothetical protein